MQWDVGMTISGEVEHVRGTIETLDHPVPAQRIQVDTRSAASVEDLS